MQHIQGLAILFQNFSLFHPLSLLHFLLEHMISLRFGLLVLVRLLLVFLLSLLHFLIIVLDLLIFSVFFSFLIGKPLGVLPFLTLLNVDHVLQVGHTIERHTRVHNIEHRTNHRCSEDQDVLPLQVYLQLCLQK